MQNGSWTTTGVVLGMLRNSELRRAFLARTADGRKKTRKTMIVALARKPLIALWRLVTTGEIPTGVMLRAA
jgi:transposase